MVELNAFSESLHQDVAVRHSPVSLVEPGAAQPRPGPG